MLILTIKPNSRLTITTKAGEVVTVINREKSPVSLGIDAPKDVKVLREGLERRAA